MDYKKPITSPETWDSEALLKELILCARETGFMGAQHKNGSPDYETWRAARETYKAELMRRLAERDALRVALEAMEWLEADENGHHWEYCPWCAGNPRDGQCPTATGKRRWGWGSRRQENEATRPRCCLHYASTRTAGTYAPGLKALSTHHVVPSLCTIRLSPTVNSIESRTPSMWSAQATVAV